MGKNERAKAYEHSPGRVVGFKQGKPTVRVTRINYRTDVVEEVEVDVFEHNLQLDSNRKFGLQDLFKKDDPVHTCGYKAERKFFPANVGIPGRKNGIVLGVSGTGGHNV